MKIAFVNLVSAATVCANIVFNHVPLKCSENSTQIYHGCLRGQVCTNDEECVAPKANQYTLPFRPRLPKIQLRDGFSTDGTCGPKFGNTVCDPNSKVYTGGCCSQYGWCGNTDGHCGVGCISGCKGGTSQQPTASGKVAPRDDGLCGKQNGGATCDPKGPFGGCCSQYGYCGSTNDHCLPANGCQSGCSGGGGQGPVPRPTPTGEPVIGKATASMDSGAQSTAAVTTDGSCGAGKGNTVCGNWPSGNCCSMYGFCGATSAHCGAGCQSGSCLGAPAVAAPGPKSAPPNPAGLGQFIVVGDSGVPAMHAALMPNGRVFFLDKLEDFTHLKLPNGRYAMSSEYDPATNQVVPLGYTTNAFCAGGAFLADGRVVSLGGNGPLDWLDPTIGDGFDAIRWLSRSATDASLNGQSWVENTNKLASKRWYASAQTMPDGSIFVASGSLNGLDPTVAANNNPTFEILNRDGTPRGQNYPMAILEKNQPYYMYPFLHLLKDGNVFVFTSKSSEIFNVGANQVVKPLPDLPGDYRTYPNTGGSVLLPLYTGNGYETEVLICGGGAYQDITSPTDPSCGRIKPLAANPTWEMDAMPEGRGMVEGTLLPDGTVLWLNGGNRGAQGFGLMANPTLQALLYSPDKPLGQRWTTLASSNIPRLYHSVALLLPDGTVMVTGSNPVEMPKAKPDQKDPYVTDFRVEIFIPPYRQGGINKQKPNGLVLSTKTITPGTGSFPISFNVPNNAGGMRVVIHHGGFVTHSVHMGQRMVELNFQGWVPGSTTQNLQVFPPPNHNIAPPGPYLLFVVVDGIPSDGQFVSIA